MPGPSSLERTNRGEIVMVCPSNRHEATIMLLVEMPIVCVCQTSDHGVLLPEVKELSADGSDQHDRSHLKWTNGLTSCRTTAVK